MTKKQQKVNGKAPQDDKDIIIQNQKQEILRLRRKVKDQEAKLIALGY